MLDYRIRNRTRKFKAEAGPYLLAGLLSATCLFLSPSSSPAAQAQASGSSPELAAFGTRARNAVVDALRDEKLSPEELDVESLGEPVAFPREHVKLHRLREIKQPDAGQPKPDEWPAMVARVAVWRQGTLDRLCMVPDAEDIVSGVGCKGLPEGWIPLSKEEWRAITSELASFHEDAADITRASERFDSYLSGSEDVFDKAIRKFVVSLIDWELHVLWYALERNDLRVVELWGGSDFFSDFCSERIPQPDRSQLEQMVRAMSDDVVKLNQAFRDLGALDPGHAALVKPYFGAFQWGVLAKELNADRIKSLSPSTVLYVADSVAFRLRFARYNNRLLLVSVCGGH